MIVRFNVAMLGQWMRLQFVLMGVIYCAPLAVIAENFPQPSNTEKSTGHPMPPAEVCRSAVLPPGFKLTAFAAEPDVQNPIAITTDDRGRLWVAENYTWAGADAGNFDVKLRDRVVILEDTDGDGRHDKRTVFWDQATRLTSIEVGFGGVWLFAARISYSFPTEIETMCPMARRRLCLTDLIPTPCRILPRTD